MEITCPNCGTHINVDEEAQIGFVTHDATDIEPAAHLILETGIGGSRLLHRCVVEI